MGNLDEGIQVRQTSRRDVVLLSTIEPKNINEAYEDLHWNKAMQEDIEQIERSGTWELVSRPKDENFIGTKWIYINKMKEEGEIVRNNSILVCKGYAQVEGVDFNETFSPVSQMEAIRMFFSYSCFKNFKVYYQMHVKSTFLKRDLHE